MKISKKVFIWTAVAVGVISIGMIFVLTRGGEEVEFVIEKVQRGDLIQTVDAVGELDSIDEVDLSFASTGTVNEIFVTVGEEVLVGDVIATLDAEELEAALRSAQQAYAIAQASLDLEIAGASSASVAVFAADVSVAESALFAAEINVTNTKSTQANAVVKAALNVTTDETNLVNTKTNNEQDLEDAKNDYMNALKSAMITVRASLADADEVLGIENTTINDDYDNYLSAINKTYLNLANKHFNLASSERDLFEPSVFALSTSSTSAEVELAAQDVESVLELTSLTLLYTRQVLDATTANTVEFSTADLLALKTSIDSARASIQSEATFIAPKQSYENGIIDADVALDNAESALASSQLAYSTSVVAQATAIATAEVALSQRTADLARSQAALSDVLSAPRNVDLAGLRADVSRGLADLDQAEARRENAQIISPIDGALTDFTLAVGEQAALGEVVATVQSTNDMFQVTVNVAESDIIKIMAGDEAEIVLDAYGDDSPIYGYVSTVDPAEKNVEGVVFYEVTVFLNEDAYLLDLKPGMSADVEMITAEIQEVLFVAQRAVLENDLGQKYVRIPMGNAFEERLISTGLRANGGMLEVLQGLNEGDEIILTIR